MRYFMIINKEEFFNIKNGILSCIYNCNCYKCPYLKYNNLCKDYLLKDVYQKLVKPILNNNNDNNNLAIVKSKKITYCSKCNFELKNRTKICPNCGRPLIWEEYIIKKQEDKNI